ncbi:MAG: adenine phosphoribosyltransferase [Nitrosomonas sp.]|nr:adenine phosphoribosyltransferase [Nitrosomonas sp.]
MPIKSLIRTIPHYPREGIMFRDITTLLKDPTGLRVMIEKIVDRYRGENIDKVVGIESRGFIVAAPVAYALGAGFVPVRKQGKLPAATIGCDYQLEYGHDRIEIHTDAINENDKVLLIDDLIATGGTMEAALKLMLDMKAEVVECCAVINLPVVGGAERLQKQGYKLHSLCTFEE